MSAPLAVKQKTDNSIKLRITDSSNTAQNITGWNLTFLLKRNTADADGDALVTVPVTPSGSDATNGTAYVDLTAAQLDLTPRAYYGVVRSVDGSSRARSTGFFPFVVTNAASSDPTSTTLNVSMLDTTLQLVMAGPTGADGGTAGATATSIGGVQLAGDLGGVATAPTIPGLATKEPVITAGTTGQYYRGDKTWQTLPTNATPSGSAGGDLAGSYPYPTVPGLMTKQAILTETPTKTAAYLVAANELVIADATSGTFTVTLPSAPASRTIVSVKKIDSSANAVTVATSGSDTFTVGGASLNLAVQGQAVSFQYNVTTSKWTATSNDVPLLSLDGRYVGLTGNQIIGGSKTFLGVTKATLQDRGGMVFHVKAYGALGDGSTDDTAAINSAVSACLAAGGGTVYIPSGTYAIATSIAIVLNGKSMIIQGDGDGTILKTTATSTGHANDIINVTGSGAIGADRIAIRDLQVLGNSTGAMGMRFNSCYQGELTNIRGRNFTSSGGWGVAVSLNQTIDFNINNLVTTGCSYSGLQLENASNANTILGGWLYSGTTGGGGCRVNSSNGNVFIGTVFETNNAYGVILSGGRITRLYGCWIENNSSTGVLTNEVGTVIDGCWFTLNASYDIDVQPTATSIKIINNRFNDGGKVRLQNGASFISIRDNENLTALTDAGSANSSYSDASKVGINRTNPAMALDVNGSATVNGSMTAGSLGGGTTAPNAKLHANDSDGAQILASTTSGSIGSIAGIEFRYSSGGASNRIARIVGSTQSGGGGDILFQTAANGAAAYATVATLSRAGALSIGNLGLTTVAGGGQITGSAGASFNVTDQVYTTNVQTTGTITVSSYTKANATRTGVAYPTASGNLPVNTSAELQLASAASAAITLTLPATTTDGIRFTIKKIDSSANAVNITATSGTIDGSATVSLTSQYSTVTVVSTTTSGVWYIANRF